MKNDINKPNKKKEIYGSVLSYVGIAMILLRIFIIKELFILIIGIILVIIGPLIAMQGKLGAEKALETIYEAGYAHENAKAKAIAKGFKEVLKDEEK